MSEKETPKLSKALEGKFEAVGVVPGVITGKKYGTVDLTTISLAKAEELVKNHFPYLRAVEKSAKAEGDKR
jgi:hypothetical protein